MSLLSQWVQIGIDVYIPHRQYQVKPHSSPWFSTACNAALVHRNHFFHLYQQNKSPEKFKFIQASNRCKRILKGTKLAYANKTKESITSQKLGPCEFWRIANSVLNKDKSALPPLVNIAEMLSSSLLHLMKQNCLLKTFLRTLILITRIIFL